MADIGRTRLALGARAVRRARAAVAPRLVRCALLYNLMLSEATQRDDLVDGYKEELDAWEQELRSTGSSTTGSAPTSGRTCASSIHDFAPRRRRSSIDGSRLVESGEHRGDAARRLISERELSLKGKRARVQFAQARETWTPGAGTARLGYRWSVARSYLADIDAGLNRAGVETDRGEVL